jgi:NADH-quinone oxidoreductase subunit J
MMLDIDFSELRAGVQRYAPIGAVVGAILFLELVLVLGGWKLAPAATGLRLAPMSDALTNTDAIGRILYTHYAFLFETASLVLMVALVGAIVLTHRDRHRSKTQDIARQNARRPADTLTMMDLPIGVGVKELGILRPDPVIAPPEQRVTLPEADAVAVTHKPGAH